MVEIDGKQYELPEHMTPENAAYTSSLIYYTNALVELEEVQKRIRRYKRKVKQEYKKMEV